MIVDEKLTQTRAGAGYLLRALILGVLASWVALAFNVVGAITLGTTAPHLLKLLRVYATFFHGEPALTGEMSGGLVILISFLLYTTTGAVVGAPLTLVYERRFGTHGWYMRVIDGAWIGILMWVISFYGVLSWLQPLALRVVGYADEPRAFIPEHIPIWVGVATHICFVESVLVLGRIRSGGPDQAKG
jgi:hypothetical protein